MIGAPSWDDLDPFLDDFGTPVLFVLASGQLQQPIMALYDTKWFDRQIGEYVMEREVPRLTCKADDVAQVGIKDSVLVGGRLVDGSYVGGTRFNVRSQPHADGTGMATVYLAPVNVQH